VERPCVFKVCCSSFVVVDMPPILEQASSFLSIMIDLASYLARIGHSGPTAPSANNLRAIHHAHLLTVPFENLDIALGRKIVVNEDAFVSKVVEQRRGKPGNPAAEGSRQSSASAATTYPVGSAGASPLPGCSPAGPTSMSWTSPRAHCRARRCERVGCHGGPRCNGRSSAGGLSRRPGRGMGRHLDDDRGRATQPLTARIARSG